MSSVDVVIPCYNYARFLQRCAQSVLTQRDVTLRVLIIDDKSSDDTPIVGEHLAASDPRVTFRRHEVNQGHIKTFNEGIMDWASAKYTLLISADDALTPGALARAVTVMDRHDDIAMTYGMAHVIRDDAEMSSAEDIHDFDYRVIPGSQFLKYCCEQGNGVPSPTAVIRTQLQHRLGGYHPKMLHTSDLEMWMRFATQASIAAVHAPQGFYRIHGSNMTLGHLKADRQMRIDTCQHIFENWDGVNIPGFEKWLARGAMTMAWHAFEDDDLESCRAYIKFAAMHNPAFRGSIAWWRQRAKLLLGPGPIYRIRSILKSENGQSRTSINAEWGSGIKELGWWPEASLDGNDKSLCTRAYAVQGYSNA